ncbi:MAG: SiaB family protein kinase [Bacteroidia bacterium]
MKDIYNLYKDLERDEIILSFKGDITQDLLSSVFSIMESRLEHEDNEPHLKKKFYHILIECLQNLYHHNETMPVDLDVPANEGSASAIFMIGRGEDNCFRIITGNYIMNSNSEELKARLDKVNGMNAEQLRAYYLDKLNTTELSDKGGAGLGMIDIARKSGHKIDYNFNKVSDKYSFFSLAVTVK